MDKRVMCNQSHVVGILVHSYAEKGILLEEHHSFAPEIDAVLARSAAQLDIRLPAREEQHGQRSTEHENQDGLLAPKPAPKVAQKSRRKGQKSATRMGQGKGVEENRN